MLVHLCLITAVVCCVVEPVSESFITSCVGNDQTDCTVALTTTFNLPMVAGSCSQLSFSSAVGPGKILSEQISMYIEVLGVFVVVSLENGIYGFNTTTGDMFGVCQCQRLAPQYCQLWDKDSLVASCNYTDHCEGNYEQPHFTFCEQEITRNCLLSESFTCGCYHDVIDGKNPKWLASFGANHIYAIILIHYTVDGVVIPGKAITYALDNTNFVDFDVAPGFSGNISYNLFHLPDTGLDGLGSFVGDYRYEGGPWIVSGVDSRTTEPPVDSPFWVRSYDLTKFLWDADSYTRAVSYQFRDCFASAVGVFTSSINHQMLGPDLLLEEKLSSEYFFLNYTFGPASHIRLFMTGDVAMQVSVSATATGVKIVDTFATATFVSAGSVFTCLDNEASFWVVLNNTGQEGFMAVRVNEPAGNFTIGSFIVQPGVSNQTFPFPGRSLGTTNVCLSSTVVSCGHFTATCINPFNPFGPNTGGNGSGGTSGSVPDWLSYLLIVLVVILILIAAVILCCCLFRL